MAFILEGWQEKDFSNFLKNKGVGVIEFGAPWCAACKIIDPILEGLSREHKDITFSKIDVSKNPGIASRMGVMSLPNILFINGGKVKDQIIGSTTKTSISEKIKKLK